MKILAKGKATYSSIRPVFCKGFWESRNMFRTELNVIRRLKKKMSNLQKSIRSFAPFFNIAPGVSFYLI